MPSWHSDVGKTHHFCDVIGDSVTVGEHHGSPHTASAGSCTREEFLGGRFQSVVLAGHGEAVLLEMIAALGGDPTCGDDAIAAWTKRNKPPEPPQRPTVPEGAVSRKRESLDQYDWTRKQLAQQIPHLDKLVPSLESMAACTELTHAMQFANNYDQWPWLEHLDVTELDGNGCSPLNMALLHSWRGDAVERLLDAGADVNAPDGNGVYPIEAMIAHPSREQIKVLKKAKVDVSRRLDGGRTFLHLAVERECTMSFSPLKKLKIDIDATDDHGRTALHYGIFNSCAVDLVKIRVDPEIEDAAGDTAFALAARGALSHRISEFHAEGTAGGKPAVFSMENNRMKVKVGKGKPRNIGLKPEKSLAREYCPDHYTFLQFMEACAWMSKRADLEAPTRLGVPVGQLVADLRRPEIAKVIKKRGVKLPAPRDTIPNYNRPLAPVTILNQ
jgi:ankyrin repeat protein